MNLPDKIEKPSYINPDVERLRMTINTVIDYLAERDRLPWDVLSLGRQTVTSDEYVAHTSPGYHGKGEVLVQTEHAPKDDDRATVNYRAGYTKGFEDGQQKMSEALDEEMDKFIKGFGYRKKK